MKFKFLRDIMLRLQALIVLGIIAIVLSGVPAEGAVVNPPPGLNPGDMYHLVFVSSTTIDATSDLISVYDTHVQGAADLSGNFIGITWKAIASTARSGSGTVAKTHIGVSAPVYRLDGTLIANNETGMFDGSIDAPINLTEFGDDRSNADVWTGSFASGLPDISFALGFPLVKKGRSLPTDEDWIDFFIAGNANDFSVYGISEKLTVQAAAVPEPSTFLLLSFACVVVGLVSRQRRRSAKPGGAT